MFIAYELPPGSGVVGPVDGVVGPVDGVIVGPVDGAVVVGCCTGVVVTGPGVFIGITEGRPDPLPVSVPTPRLGVVATMPAGTWICVGLVLADAVRLAEAAGDAAAGLAGDISLVGFIG